MEKIVKENGLLSFYSGLKMALIATTASYGSYFFLYRLAKNFVYNLLKIKTLTKRHIAIITAFAGALSALFGNPFWFTNTRLIKENKEKKDVQILSLVREIHAKEGIQAFYKGALPNMILVLNPIINFVIYEEIKKKFP